MYIAPDGSRWHTGVRYFYDGEYHKTPSKNPRGATYHVFAPIDGDGGLRVYMLKSGDRLKVDAAERARRFAVAEYAAREKFDGGTRDPR